MPQSGTVPPSTGVSTTAAPVSSTAAALGEELRVLRTPDQILSFRQKLDKGTAQAVIRSLSAVDRAAVLLCLQFAGTNRFDRFNSEIIDDLDGAAIWAAGSEQVVEKTIPSLQPLSSYGRSSNREQHRSTARRRTR